MSAEAMIAEAGDLDLPTLHGALEKVQRRRFQPANDREPFTAAELDALSVWMQLQILTRGKETREERSERNRAAWQGGDRRLWGGELRKRDRRRGWRNH